MAVVDPLRIEAPGVPVRPVNIRALHAGVPEQLRGPVPEQQAPTQRQQGPQQTRSYWKRRHDTYSLDVCKLMP